MDRRSLYFILSMLGILAVATAVFLYAKGYSFDRQKKSLEKTGMVVVKSLPDGARIYLSGKLVQASNATLTALKPGLHTIRLEKDGFGPFEKEVPVQEEFVTSLEAALIPLNPELKPLTKSGAKSPVLTASRDKIIFLTSDKDRPGLWTLSLSGNLFSLIKGNLESLVPDSEKTKYSLAEAIFLSPNDEELLVKMNNRGYLLLNLTQTRNRPSATASAEKIIDGWAKIAAQNKLKQALKAKLPLGLTKIASDSASLWSPDNLRFLYRQDAGKALEYHVRDLNTPLGVGEKEDYTTIRIEKTSHTQVSWYADSRHLLLTTCEEEDREEKCLRGNIKLLRIDGTNLTQIYSGALAGIDVFPTPDGTKLVILTNFNQTIQPNLYAIILR